MFLSFASEKKKCIRPEQKKGIYWFAKQASRKFWAAGTVVSRGSEGYGFFLTISHFFLLLCPFQKDTLFKQRQYGLTAVPGSHSSSCMSSGNESYVSSLSFHTSWVKKELTQQSWDCCPLKGQFTRLVLRWTLGTGFQEGFNYSLIRMAHCVRIIDANNMIYADNLCSFCGSGIWVAPSRRCLRDQHCTKILMSPSWISLVDDISDMLSHAAGGIKCFSCDCPGRRF